MNLANTEIDIPVAHPQPANTNLGPFFPILFQWICHILTPASIAIRDPLVAPLRHLWAHYYRRVAFGGGGVAFPQSTLGFVINALLALAEIKSQSLPGFPFQTHPLLIMFSVTCLLIYGLASAVELVVSCAGLDPTSVYAVTAHLGKIGSLCILVASLASLFYI